MNTAERRARGYASTAPGPEGYHHIVRPRAGKRLFRTVVLWAAGFVAACYLCATVGLVALRWINPLTTAVQAQRRVESWVRHRPYRKYAVWMPLERISPDLQRAVISAEDGRFYEHHGIDWKEVDRLIDEDLDEGRLGRGGSTITQQLVKNLFFTTHRSVLRKVVEFTLAPLADRLLPKRRILELYLNVIEWGPGVYGAEAASQTWYGTPAARLNREQAARLAAVIPAPLRRKPSRMTWYSTEIQKRMSQHGW